MRYFECDAPPGDGCCSDDACPCPETHIPRGTGYLYISQSLVDFRSQYPRMDDAQRAKVAQLEQKRSNLTRQGLAGGNVNFFYRLGPILVCEQGARQRNLDLQIAAADAQHWWRTGQVPLRATPVTADEGPTASAATASPSPPSRLASSPTTGGPITGRVTTFEVFDRTAIPNGAVAAQVCQRWTKGNPAANIASANVKVNRDTSGLWDDVNVRAHYPLLHYRGAQHTWEFVTVGNKQYLLLVVYQPTQPQARPATGVVSRVATRPQQQATKTTPESEKVHLLCPKCNKHQSAPRKLIGKKGKCSGCGHVFPIVDQGLKPAVPSSAPSGPAEPTRSETGSPSKSPWWKFGRKGKASTKPATSQKAVMPARQKQTPRAHQPNPSVGGVPGPISGQPFLQVGTDYVIDGSQVRCTNCQSPLSAQQIDAVSRIRFKQLPAPNSVKFDCARCQQKFAFPPGPAVAPMPAQPRFGQPPFGQPGIGGFASPIAPMALGNTIFSASQITCPMCSTPLNYAQQQSVEQLLRVNSSQQLGQVQIECSGCKRKYLLSQVR